MSRTPLRIALVRGRYNPFGGAERFVNNALRALPRDEVSLSVITRAWDGAAGDVEAIRCRSFYVGRVWRDAAFARCVCRETARRSFDLVQSHERIPCCDVFRAGDGVHREWLRQRARISSPLARLGTALSPYHLYVKYMERRLFESPRLRAVICNSQMVRDEILREFAIAPRKCRVVYTGVDTQRFHPKLKQERAALRARFQIPESAPLFLFLGSGFARKGVAACLRAVAGVPHAQLMVVGKDKDEPRFRRLAARIGIAARVHFAGAQTEPAPFYGAADAFVLPTLYDPLPNAALEAMAAGLPIITSTKSGAAELIENGKQGFVCDALDIESLADAMRALCDRGRAASMGAAARIVAERLDTRDMAAQLMALYRELLGIAADERAVSP